MKQSEYFIGYTYVLGAFHIKTSANLLITPVSGLEPKSVCLATHFYLQTAPGRIGDSDAPGRGGLAPKPRTTQGVPSQATLFLGLPPRSPNPHTPPTTGPA